MSRTGVSALNQRHYAWLMDHITGKTNVEIAQRFGILPTTVSKVLNSDVAAAEIQLLKEKLTNYHMDIAGQIEGLRPKAVEILGDTLQADPGTDDKAIDRQLKVALEVLRGPLNVKEEENREEDPKGVHIHIKGKTAEDIIIMAAIKGEADDTSRRMEDEGRDSGNGSGGSIDISRVP